MNGNRGRFNAHEGNWQEDYGRPAIMHALPSSDPRQKSVVIRVVEGKHAQPLLHGHLEVLCLLLLNGLLSLLNIVRFTRIEHEK